MDKAAEFISKLKESIDSAVKPAEFTTAYELCRLRALFRLVLLESRPLTDAQLAHVVEEEENALADLVSYYRSLGDDDPNQL
jgi:hypothetical protein